MKKFTQARTLSVSLCLLLVAMLMVSSCTSPQHFSFSQAPPSYQKVTKVSEATVVTAEEATTLTASIAPEEQLVLPEIAALQKEVVKEKVMQQNVTTVAQPVKKLSLTQKIVLKNLQKQVTKLEKKSQKENQVIKTTAGPVSNKSAIALILIGFLAILFGALLGIGVFYTLGALVVFIGLVLLILNYI